MPVFRSGKNLAPAWCEMEYFDIVRLKEGNTQIFERLGSKEKLFVGEGHCRIAQRNGMTTARPGDIFDLAAAEERFEINEVFSPTVLVRVCGHWGEEIGGCGVFTLDNSEPPQNLGDQTSYPRTTNFDNHFHDCDEYWIIYEGKGLAVSEGKFYEIGPGDCVATASGHHHDFPQVYATVKGVYFETTLKGRKRRGHLWNHTHGFE